MCSTLLVVKGLTNVKVVYLIKQLINIGNYTKKTQLKKNLFTTFTLSSKPPPMSGPSGTHL